MNCLRRSLNVLLQKKKNFGVSSFCQLASEKSASALNETSNSLDLASPKEPSYERSSNFILDRALNISSSYVKPREVWVENLDKIKEEKRGIVKLHPKIFGTMPRLDIIFENVKWQTKYKTVITYSAPTRAERPGGGRKPYPQKGLGKARHGSIRAPQFKGGGKAHGPRNPTSHYYMLQYHLRLHGLTSTLSAKFAQDDIRVIEDLNMPTDDSQYILNLIKERKWGPSVLFVDDTDVMPRNITIATENIGHVTLMPVYGLNVISMLKHDTLVLTLAALNEIEEKLLTLLNTANPLLAAEFHNS